MDTITRNHRTDYERWWREQHYACPHCETSGWIVRSSAIYSYYRCATEDQYVCTNCWMGWIETAAGLVGKDGELGGWDYSGRRLSDGVDEAEVTAALARWDAIHRHIVEGIADGSIIADEDPGAAASRLARQGWTPPTR